MTTGKKPDTAPEALDILLQDLIKSVEVVTHEVVRAGICRIAAACSDRLLQEKRLPEAVRGDYARFVRFHDDVHDFLSSLPVHLTPNNRDQN